MAETKQYRLRAGFTHYVVDPDGGSRQAHAGEVVELTKPQAEAFADRFESVDGDVPKTPDPVRRAAGVDAGEKLVSLPKEQQAADANKTDDNTVETPGQQFPKDAAKPQQQKDAK